MAEIPDSDFKMSKEYVPGFRFWGAETLNYPVNSPKKISTLSGQNVKMLEKKPILTLATKGPKSEPLIDMGYDDVPAVT